MLTALYPGKLPSAAVSRGRSGEPALRYVNALMLVAVSHQLWLCLLYTQFGIGGKSTVMIAEILMLAAALPLLLKRLPLGFYLAAALLVANAVTLALLRDSLDPKPLRDLLVPLVFLGVGMSVGGEGNADRLLKRVVWLVLAFAMFEFMALGVFTRFFDIQSFYLARGVGAPEMGLYRPDKLVASGMRPDAIGRMLAAFLGPHRVSSIFIEPVSLGNFAVICAAWGLAKAREQWREAAFFVAAAVVMTVLSDSRFATLTIGVLLLLRLVPLRGAETLLMPLPFLCVGALALVAFATGGEYSDSLVGRLTLTGRTLMTMGGGELFGFDQPAQRYFDMGYPYVLANFGLFACLLLWAAFWLLPAQGTATTRRFHAFVAIYLVLILCVSGNSAFAFKTSAVLWYLLGSLVVSSQTPLRKSVGAVASAERRGLDGPGG
ncbi:polysaccharide polymerase [Aromatoleum bremense]|uniref:Polysaccharide polymerase n=1 Tax=Aromatoleum bremense TaxID=76115 RepID=A0ABX1NQ70_9RHOO|nr:polysaccharide polymerase [Aromatoleum bremense]NMG14115.1 polysaccharide polymerase [Aromatoleum bremense]QTQ33891.1 Uncharacterized protein pbN1_39080 [Aromatoleum bremense]